VKRISYRVIFIFLSMIIFLPIVVNANIVCNDGTVSPSCGDCHRGCCSHHGGCSSGSSSSSSGSGGTTNNNSSFGNSNYTTQQPAIKEAPKSNDVSLEKVTIDYENIDISDSMSYSTTKESVSIYVAANDDKATTEYNSSAELIIGDNIIGIKVTAENGDVKEYKLNIIRKKVLSNNKNIKIIVDGKEVVFDSFKSKTIYLSNSKDKIDIKYELEDKNAQAEVIGNEDLKVGLNEVIVKVTAENGENQNYTIVIERYGKIGRGIIDIVSSIVMILFFGGICYVIYPFLKWAKK